MQKKSGITKSGLGAMPLFLLDDLLKGSLKDIYSYLIILISLNLFDYNQLNSVINNTFNFPFRSTYTG